MTLRSVVTTTIVALSGLLLVGDRGSAAIHTLNLDFGNAGAYADDDGVLSALGGAHWNEVTLQDFPPGSGTGTQFTIPPLRDEFGLLVPRAEILVGSILAQPNVDAASAPLNDGMTLDSSSSFFGLSLRSFKSTTPIDLVVYFNSPASSPLQTSSITVNPMFGSGGTTAQTLASTGTFPGVAGRDYLRFNNLSPIATTLDATDPRPGVILTVPTGALAHIAAVQIRGDFVPEPGSLALGMIAAAALCGFQRRRFPAQPTIAVAHLPFRRGDVACSAACRC